MSEEQFILAIDLGTSGCKAALISQRGRVACWRFKEVPTQLLPNGGAEQDPQHWWDALVETSRDLISTGEVPADRIVAICSNTQGEGTVPVDRDGRHLMNAILWMDARGAEHLKRITGGAVRVAGYGPYKLWRWIRLTGGAPSLTGKDGAAHMLLIKHDYPDVYRDTYKFLGVIDYINLRLTGRFTTTVDSIMTSWVTDNRDPGNIVYNDALVRNSGIDPDKFPDIVACTDVVGPTTDEFARAVGLPAAIPVVAGAIDTTAAAIGSGAVRDFDTHLYIGTSSWLAAHVPFKKTDIATSMASVPCAVPNRYLLTGLQATAGGNLTFLRDKILYHKDELLQEEDVPDVYKIMDRIAAKTPAGSNGVICTPWIYGERAPVDDRHVRASIMNLSLENSREDIIRSVLEGVALNTRWMMPPVEKFLGRTVKHINMVGGGALSDVWCQIFADVLDREIRQVKDPIQANARGAAFIGAVGLGMLSFDDIPDLIEYDRVYQPTPEHKSVYDERFERFVEIYKQNKKIYRRLNG
ncbi:MAG: xylulose kinase [bacterium]|nr:xylulose kinase [bacterium]